MLNEKATTKYKVPIWLSNWKFKDKKGKEYTVNLQVVKGYNKGAIFTNQEIVNKVVKKIIGSKKKHTLVPVNLTLVSQHGYGIED
tara:strand:- start:86 stop:340 length:255 start_codon:yes stop_codon:yes gene_type:complete